MTQNGRVVRDYVTNADTGAFVRCLDFFYDEAGRPFAMRSYYDSTITGYDTFHYVLNAQGDVVQLNYQGKQDKVYAQYTYDAWGNVLSKSGTLADINPLRYRGYYYDTETGFYYLQSRYYDPIVKRFLNADSYGSTGQGFLGFNMFAYCGNNPVNVTDPDGHMCIPANISLQMTDTGDHGGGVDGSTGGGGGVIASLLLFALIYEVFAPSNKPSPMDVVLKESSYTNEKANLPSVKKVTLDMVHILSGHSSGGNRGPNKDRFPSWMTPALIEKAIRFAYENEEKAGSMQYSWPKNGLGEVCKQFFIGHWGGMEIHFRFNYTMKIIETAWPK